MNPFDAVGTARITPALYDRSCRVAMGYQDEDAERGRGHRGHAGPPDLVHRAVRAVRITRDHPELRIGASVRGAIDTVLIAVELAVVRGLHRRRRAHRLRRRAGRAHRQGHRRRRADPAGRGRRRRHLAAGPVRSWENPDARGRRARGSRGATSAGRGTGRAAGRTAPAADGGARTPTRSPTCSASSRPAGPAGTS